MPAQRIDAGENVADVLAQLFEREALAVVAHEIAAGASVQDKHAPPSRAVIRLHHEIVDLAEDFGQAPQHSGRGDRGIDRRRRHADANAQVAHAQLVVHEWKLRARVVIEDIRGITLVHTENAELAKPPR